VPAVVYVLPLNVYELPVQMLAVVVEVDVAFTDNTRMAILSHPALLVRVEVYVPAVVYILPLNVYEVPAQILVVVFEVDVAFTVNTNVAILSHPTLLVSVDVYVPALEYVLPLNVYVVPAQILADVFEVDVAFIANTNVAILSQPTLLVSVDVNVPAVVYVLPLNI